MLVRREVMRASVTKKLAHGERYVLIRAYLSDGTIEQQTNPGLADPVDLPWKRIGRYRDIDQERRRLASEGWSFEPSGQ